MASLFENSQAGGTHVVSRSCEGQRRLEGVTQPEELVFRTQKYFRAMLRRSRPVDVLPVSTQLSSSRTIAAPVSNLEVSHDRLAQVTVPDQICNELPPNWEDYLPFTAPTNGLEMENSTRSPRQLPSSKPTQQSESQQSPPNTEELVLRSQQKPTSSIPSSEGEGNKVYRTSTRRRKKPALFLHGQPSQ